MWGRPGFYQDVFAVLLCRVCLGKFHFSEDRFDSTGQGPTSVRDSLVYLV